MPAVPDNVLNWLYSVLTSEYLDVNRTYRDTAQALSAYPSLAPRTEIYTYENGTSALLLLLSGTIPVPFRGTVYRFPVALWVPHAYPREAPLVYVTPVEGMLVRPGQHVSGDGKVYHPYLVKWAGFWDKSSLLDLVAILREVFAKEPPVISKQAAQSQGSQPTVAPTPPPPPPPPPPQEDWRRVQQPTSQVGSPPVPQQQDGRPPPRPPKGNEGARPMSITQAEGPRRLPNQGPPLPPLPQLRTTQQRPPSQTPWQDALGPAQPRIPFPSRQGSLQNEPSPYTQSNLPPHMRYEQSHHELESPVSPMTPSVEFPQRQFPPQPPPPQQNAPPNPYHQQQHPPPHGYQQPPPNYQYSTQQPEQRRPAPQPQIDLLSSPLDVQLPGQTGSPAPPIPVPPVPPNPEKDALLHALSQSLVSQANQVIVNNNAALQSLSAQHQALLAAQHTLQAELDSLAHLSSILDGNELALRQGIQQIDSSIASVSSRRQPEIDEVLVCPTVVGQQTYNAVAEEQAARDVRLALGRAMDKGRVGVKEYVKEMRGVGREEFFRKAVVSKAGVGMGLDLGAVGAGSARR